MMVVMTPQATAEQIRAVVDRLESAGVHAKVMPGELTTAIGAIGDPEGVRAMGLEGLPGVDQVIPISRVGGGETFCLIAGPCTVESPGQTRAVARAVAQAGASMLRGGAFKPRTSPWSFQGLGTQGLDILKEVRGETGLPVVSEMTDPLFADRFAEIVDVVQVGARNMQNYGLLEVVGKLGKPVLLKRGLSSTLDELLMAADYILKEGNERVILCERGIRTFETATRFTLDLGAIPWLKLHTHLPVIVDPSHASGDRRLVAPLSRAAAAAGADGIIVEVAVDPEAALCDGPQQLYARDFDAFAEDVAAHAGLLGKRLA
jgi:3-deoxy-7-phosphoheptulonate synthase